MSTPQESGFESRPALLDRPHQWLDANQVRTLTGVRAWTDVSARDCSQASGSGAVRFKITARDDAWVYVVLGIDGSYILETGRMMVGGALDGAWIRLGFHDAVSADHLGRTVRSCALEV